MMVMPTTMMMMMPSRLISNHRCHRYGAVCRCQRLACGQRCYFEDCCCFCCCGNFHAGLLGLQGSCGNCLQCRVIQGVEP